MVSLKQIAKKGLENLLSPKTPNIIDMILGRGDIDVIDSESLLKEVKKRVSKSIKEGYSYQGLTKESNRFLRTHNLETLEVVVMYVDLVGSTSVILSLPNDIVAKIMSTFAQEMGYIIKRYDGYVLKFAGDAVIGYFLTKNVSSQACDRAVSCAESMIKVLKHGINPILLENGLLELEIKIGIDRGEVTIVRYGDDPDEAHIDILGPSINIAAKIQGLAHPDQIMIGYDVYELLHDSIKEYFVPANLDESEWGYRTRGSEKIYPVYSYIGK